jgi:mono/diheme cytochrome c family protein
MSTHLRLVGLAAAISLSAAGGSARAADEITPPTDPVAKAAFDVLDKHCARCHQDGRLGARTKPAKNFGNVLKLEELAANPHYITPGNPFGSRVMKQIVDKEMPYDVIYEGSGGPDMTQADVKALETWIQGLGAKSAGACEGRKFVSHRDEITYIAADLDKLSKTRAYSTRYLTLMHLKNACMDDNAMKVYRQGAVKVINSLSRSSDVIKLEAIDPDQTILRINLDDLGWEQSDWDKVLAVYPYDTQPDMPLTAVLENSTGTRLPYVRADWFAFQAARPPLYDELLRLPGSFQGLAREHGVDLEANIRKFIAQRSGFQKSGVSQNNRLIERHPSKIGYFWTSYDFGGNRKKQSLFEFPLGPHDNGFEHDGGETIFSLPNGFQGYYLNTADGKKLDKGPTNIVRDLSSKDLTVTNGISCMGCHDQGMRKAKDDVRGTVLTGRAFSREIRETVEALYPPSDKMDNIIANDGRKFTNAMSAAGLESTLKLNGVEMINALAKRYEDDLDTTLAAAELGMTKKDFLDAAADADKRFRPLVRRLEQGVLPRDQFEALFREFAEEVTDEERVGHGIGKNKHKPHANRPTEAKRPAEPNPYFKEKIEAARPKRTADLSLTSDRDRYPAGDTPVFTVVSPTDCFLTLTSVDARGEGTVLLPNKFYSDNRLRANVPFEFPGSTTGTAFKFRLKDRGVETVTAVCGERREVDGIKHDFGKSELTSVPNYSDQIARSVTVKKRAIVVEPGGPGPGPQAQARPAPSAPPRDSSRSAIKIEVR